LAIAFVVKLGFVYWACLAAVFSGKLRVWTWSPKFTQLATAWSLLLAFQEYSLQHTSHKRETAVFAHTGML